jgi:hypothetical protein
MQRPRRVGEIIRLTVVPDEPAQPAVRNEVVAPTAQLPASALMLTGKMWSRRSK